MFQIRLRNALPIAAMILVFKINLSENTKIWSILIAGSKGWPDYRHQADVCHMFHILRRYDIKKKNMVVMMYDDIAYHRKNPFPGKIFNNFQKRNIYKGVPKDYTGKAISVQNLKRVLNGKGPGKAIHSNENDYIFLYYSDHGMYGGLPMITGNLYATDLRKILKSLAEKKKFKRMFVVIESCHSGSMFHKLLNRELPIYVITAARPKENSYAMFYSKDLKNFLSNELSANLMYLLQKRPDLTLRGLYKELKKMVLRSEVTEYGNREIAKMKVGKFLSPKIPISELMEEQEDYDFVFNSSQFISRMSIIDLPLELLEIRKKEATLQKEKMKIIHKMQEIKQIRAEVREVVRTIVMRIVKWNKKKLQQLDAQRFMITPQNAECAKRVTIAFSVCCISTTKNPYVMNHIIQIIAACNVHWTNLRKIRTATCHTCRKMDNLPTTVL